MINYSIAQEWECTDDKNNQVLSIGLQEWECTDDENNQVLTPVYAYKNESVLMIKTIRYTLQYRLTRMRVYWW